MFVAHVVLHAVVPQTYGSHGEVLCAQLPEPLHAPRSVAVTPVQLAVPHTLDELGYVHAAAFVPSHVATHAPVPPQAVRAPRGAPTTVVQVPGVTSQA